VLLTGYARDVSALTLNADITGTFALLRKPVLIHDLVDRIEVLLSARQPAA
jgi:hypothetical protein